MLAPEIYVCDADCLINLYRHFKQKAIEIMRHLASTSRLKIPEGIVREIIRHTDSLARFVKSHQYLLTVSIRGNPQLHSEIGRLESQYGETITIGDQSYSGFWKSKAGRQAADAQVIAVARLLKGVAVSDDRAVKLACALEDVPCISWSEFARRIGLIGPKQLELEFGDTEGNP